MVGDEITNKWLPAAWGQHWSSSALLLSCKYFPAGCKYFCARRMTNILWYCEGQGKCWTTFDTFLPERQAAACVCSACKNFTILTFRNLPLTLSCFISEIFQICSIIEYYICTLGKIEGRKLRISRIHTYFTRGPHRDGGTWNQCLISTHSEWYDKYWVWSGWATKVLMSRSPCRWPPAPAAWQWDISSHPSVSGAGRYYLAARGTLGKQ